MTTTDHRRPIEVQFAKDDKAKALRYLDANADVPLRQLLTTFPARGRDPLNPQWLDEPLRHFRLIPIRLPDGEGVDLSPSPAPAKTTAPTATPADPTRQRPTEATTGHLRDRLDALYAADVADEMAVDAFPDDIKEIEAVRIAYRHELKAVANFLRHGLSVLIVCDKVLTEYIYDYVCAQAGRTPVLDDAQPPAGQGGGQAAALQQAMGGGGAQGIEQTLPTLLRNLREHETLVLRSIDLLDKPHLVEALYQNTRGGAKPQLLGFVDPSTEVKKVLSDRFAVRAAVQGLSRHIQPDPEQPPVHTVTRLITAAERRCFQRLDPEGLYKNVAGLNAVQFRNAMRYVGATVAEATPARAIYEEIRIFKTSSSTEIDIPDTTFADIGGYEAIKGELQRIVALATGPIAGMPEEERRRLIPRGFVFHGPPGTGKTLFAKAIANEMNATIQMVSGPEIMDKYVGQSESNLRAIFATARRNAPAVILFDEFDSIAGQRSAYADGGARANNAVVAQLLTELDGLREDQSVMLIGTTNRIDIVDEALLRPARLRPIQIDRPDYTARRAVAAIHAKRFKVDGLLADLFTLVQTHAADWRPGSPIPEALTDALFEAHPPYRLRWESEAWHADLLRELTEFRELITEMSSTPPVADAPAPLEQQLIERVDAMARRFGVELGAGPSPGPSPEPTDGAEPPDAPAADRADIDSIVAPMRHDLAGLIDWVQTRQRNDPDQPMTADGFVAAVLDLLADFTEGFNNDEIRAVFQEASLEHYLEGQPVTPRRLGYKVGLIRRRRDERQVVHLEQPGGRGH